MSEEEINIEIAEHLGILSYHDQEKMIHVKGSGFFTSKEHAASRLPNYCGDLNAMHDAEDTLTDDQFRVYFNKLEAQLPYPRLRRSLRHVCTAKARNRADAFLVALGKWRE